MDDSLFSDQPAPQVDHLFSEEPLPKMATATPTGFPEPQVSDNPAAGAEVPEEQRVLNNASALANGYMLPKSIIELGGAAAGAVGGKTLNTLAEYAKRFGQNQAMKTVGASGGQIGQVGIPESRAIAQKLIDKGAIRPFRGPIGLEEKVGELSQEAGKGIGEARAAGDAAGTAPQMSELLKAVKDRLEPKYTSGVEKGLGGLNRAREEIAKGGTGTFTGNAAKATDLNASASANKIYRPTSSTSDTADVISHMNNEALKKALTPEQYAKYQSDLSDYGDFEKVKKFLERGERREMGGRMGAGSVTKALADKTMDSFGNRMSATLGSKVGDMLKTDPGAAAAKLPGAAKQLVPSAVAEWIAQQDKRQDFAEGGEVQQPTPKPINDVSDEIRAWIDGKVQAYRQSDQGTLKGLQEALKRKPKETDSEEK